MLEWCENNFSDGNWQHNATGGTIKETDAMRYAIVSPKLYFKLYRPEDVVLLRMAHDLADRAGVLLPYDES